VVRLFRYLFLLGFLIVPMAWWAAKYPPEHPLLMGSVPPLGRDALKDVETWRLKRPQGNLDEAMDCGTSVFGSELSGRVWSPEGRGLAYGSLPFTGLSCDGVALDLKPPSGSSTTEELSFGGLSQVQGSSLAVAARACAFIEDANSRAVASDTAGLRSALEALVPMLADDSLSGRMAEANLVQLSAGAGRSASGLGDALMRLARSTGSRVPLPLVDHIAASAYWRTAEGSKARAHHLQRTAEGLARGLASLNASDYVPSSLEQAQDLRAAILSNASLFVVRHQANCPSRGRKASALCRVQLVVRGPSGQSRENTPRLGSAVKLSRLAVQAVEARCATSSLWSSDERFRCLPAYVVGAEVMLRQWDADGDEESLSQGVRWASLVLAHLATDDAAAPIARVLLTELTVAQLSPPERAAFLGAFWDGLGAQAEPKGTLAEPVATRFAGHLPLFCTSARAVTHWHDWAPAACASVGMPDNWVALRQQQSEFSLEGEGAVLRGGLMEMCRASPEGAQALSRHLEVAYSQAVSSVGERFAFLALSVTVLWLISVAFFLMLNVGYVVRALRP
jgi:hypothetical protein